MWKIRAALLYVFISISDAVGSNSTVLESKINKCLYPDHDYVGPYDVLSSTQNKFVVSVGWLRCDITFKVYHVCFAVIFSPRHAVTSAYRIRHGYKREKDSMSGDISGNFFINFKRFESVSLDDVIPIETAELVVGQQNDLSFLTLSDPIPSTIENGIHFLAESDFPVFQGGTNMQADSIIGWNMIETRNSYLPLRRFIKVPVIWVNDQTCPVNPELGLFCVRIESGMMLFDKQDFGGPVMYENKVVGIIIRMDRHFAIAARFHFDEILLGDLSNSMQSLQLA